MGMFDYVRVEMPLPAEPAPPPPETRFQTKDSPDGYLFLETLVLRSDGTLIRPGIRYEDRSDPNEEGLKRLIGMMSPVSDPLLDTVFSDFHGDFEFGHYVYETGEDWDYVARFTEGKCTKIWCRKYTPPSKDKD